MIEDGLFAFLTNRAEIAALVLARVYPTVVPQEATFPCLSFQRISTARTQALDGPTGCTPARFQLTCWGDRRYSAPGFKDARTLANTVRAALNGFSGAFPDGTQVQGAFLSDERDSFEAAQELDRVDLDFIIWHQED